MLPAVNVLIIRGLTLPNVDQGLIDRILAAGGAGTEVVVADSPGEAMEAIEEAEVLLGQINRQLFLRAPKLRWVHAITAGADAYLFDEMCDSEVLLSGDKGLVGTHLAETAFGLLLAITRRIAQAVLDGPESWEHRVEYRRAEFELEGLTMGIVGLGGTGREIAKRAAAFGMDCIAVDCDPVPPTPEVPEVWGTDRFDELLQTSDVVASGLPLTPDTREIFNARAFELMKPSAILVNVTRGELVDGIALAEAVRSGQIAGAGLDVAPQEPLPADHPLWSTPNVVMTPHTAGASQYRMGRNLDRFCRNIEHYRKGEPLEGQIDKQRGF
jgi:phosphoglycerate dehydrogenase-like enzyme